MASTTGVSQVPTARTADSTSATWRPTPRRWRSWARPTWRVLSEESGRTGVDDSDVVVVVDPLDGSTNAARGIPWFATSLCAVDR